MCEQTNDIERKKEKKECMLVHATLEEGTKENERKGEKEKECERKIEKKCERVSEQKKRNTYAKSKKKSCSLD